MDNLENKKGQQIATGIWMIIMIIVGIIFFVAILLAAGQTGFIRSLMG